MNDTGLGQYSFNYFLYISLIYPIRYFLVYYCLHQSSAKLKYSANIYIIFIFIINFILGFFIMCLGPKCPCIYPKVKHIQMPYVSFRERSLIDRVSIKN